MKKIFKISVSKVYVVYLLLLTVFIVGTYSSYAYFTVNKEKKKAINMITGNLTGSLLIDGEEANTLIVDGESSKVFSVKLINNNERQARFNLYYKGNYNNVEIGYSKGEGLNNPPISAGVNLEANKTLGYFQSYKIIVRNKSTSKVEIPLEYQVGLDYNDLTLPSDGHVIEEIKELTGVETLLVNYTNDEELQDYNNSNDIEKKNMYVFDHEKGVQQEGYSKGELRDYRYIGVDPNNYVTFNNETWRIIGIFTVEDENGKKEQRIKLIRKELLPDYYRWDSTNGESIYGRNRWGDSQLQKLLNEGYDNETGGSLYWNRKNGLCYAAKVELEDTINGTMDCSFEQTGLMNTAKSQVGKTKWYLGGVSDNTVINSVLSYKEERGNEVCSLETRCTYFKENFKRDISWIGNVALMYTSDYGYATSGGNTTSRETCSKKYILDWYKAEISDCKNNNWLYHEDANSWAINAGAHGANMVIHFDSRGGLYFGYPKVALKFQPTLYLKSSIKIVKGNGSEMMPFELE